MQVEAKKADLKLGLAQCMAEMIAAQIFNHRKGNPTRSIYGAITSGTQWRFMQLIEQTVTIDLNDYSLPPVEAILAKLVWTIAQG
jgi:hypothetical protein